MVLPPAARGHPHACSSCALHRSFCNLPDDVRAAFDDIKTTLSYRKGDTIFHEGDRCLSVFAICEGSVKLITTSNEGRILLHRFVKPGEMIGLAEVLDAAPYDCSAIAAEDSVLAVIGRETFLRFIGSYPQAGLGLTIALSEQYKLAQRETRFLGLGETSSVRLAQLLLDWSREHGVAGDKGLQIEGVTHGDLAQAIAATRETVTRLLGRLSRAGIIERRGNSIIVLRTDELARISASQERTS